MGIHYTTLIRPCNSVFTLYVYFATPPSLPVFALRTMAPSLLMRGFLNGWEGLYRFPWRYIHEVLRRWLRSFSSESGQIPERVSKRVQIPKSQLDVHHFPRPWSLKAKFDFPGATSNRFQTHLRTTGICSSRTFTPQSHLLTVSILHENLIQNLFYF